MWKVYKDALKVYYTEVASAIKLILNTLNSYVSCEIKTELVC